MTALLDISNLSVFRGECPVVDTASLQIKAGDCVGLIGPNGAGKTSLMRAALGLLPHSGSSSLAEMPRTSRARHAAWLPQARDIAWPMTVERVVALGRIPHLPRGARLQETDAEAVDRALNAVGFLEARHRIATELSGGEQARVLIARALAQDTPLLMADEPIAGLDPANQISTMECFATLAASGRGVLVSLHDLGLAARHCTRLILMNHGCIIADSAPKDVLTQANLAHVFNVTAHFESSPKGTVFQALDVLK